MAERTTVRLPPSLLSAAKKKAAAEGRTLTALIEDGLRLVVSDAPKKRARRFMPRVSDAKGPPHPGIDISDGSALQELDDMEYIERLKRGFE